MTRSFLNNFGKTLPLLVCLSLGQFSPAAEPTAEELSDRAGAALKRLAGPLVDGAEFSPDSVAEKVACGPLRTKAARAGTFPDFLVDRFPLSGKEPPRTGRAALAAEFAALREALPGSGRQVKFKIIRVEPGPETVKTRQLFTLMAETPEGPAEHNATWETVWQRRGEELILASLRSLDAEETRSRRGPLLADCTQDLLGGLPWFREQMGHGNPWWRARLEKQFEVFLFGHHGLALGDVNGDGLDDVYLCQTGGLPNRLLLQQPDGSVVEAPSSGTDLLDHTRSALIVDLDNDGDQDLVLGLTQGILFLEGDNTGKFTRRALLPRVTDAQSIAAADYDGNGTLDLFVCGYQPRDSDPARVPYPVPFYDARNGGENFLVRNEGGWKFTNATEETGLNVDNFRFSFAATWTDVDSDGDPDLAVVNDFGRMNLYVNSKAADGRITFRDVALERGLGQGSFGMSISAADCNRDGFMDLYVGAMFSSAGNRITNQPDFKDGLAGTDLERFRHLANGNSLFLNDGKGQFVRQPAEAGVNMGRWSWSSVFADLTNDGWEDILVANGNITGHGLAPDL